SGEMAPSRMACDRGTKVIVDVSARAFAFRFRLSSSTALAPLVALSLVAASPALAQVVWDGDTDSDWATGDNWDGGTAPTNVDQAVINNGALANQPVLSTVEEVDQVVMSDGTLDVT